MKYIKIAFLVLSSFVFIQHVFSSSDTQTILSADQGVRRVLIDASGDLWVLHSRSSVIQKYSRNGLIRAGFDISSLPGDMISPRERKTVHDLALDESGRISALVGASDRKAGRIASAIYRFSDDGNLEVITLEEDVAAYRFAADAQGNWFILGLRAADFLGATLNHVSGSYPIIHQFSSGGRYLCSGLSIFVDAKSEERLMRSLSSPLHHEGNFAVSRSGESWVLLFEFPEDAGPPAGGIPSRLYRVGPDCQAKHFKLDPPLAGFSINSIVTQSDSGTTIIDWKGPGEMGNLETILGTPEGAIVARGDYPGRVLAVTNNEVVFSAAGVVEGKTSLLGEKFRTTH